MDRPRHIAFYPGSFDPITYGHLDVMVRGRRLFDHLVVGVGHNPDKESLFTVEERVEMVRTLLDEAARSEPGAASYTIESYSGLTVDFASKVNATVLLRGIRNISDLQSEVQQALTNREVAGLESAFVVAGQNFAYTSSTLIKQIAALGKDLDVLRSMCPPLVIERLKEKKAAGHPMLRRIVAHG